MTMQEYTGYLVQWLEEQRINNYKMRGYVIGISGGIDSAVVAHLLARTGAPVHGVILPSDTTSEQDVNDAIRVANSAGIPYTIAPITAAHATFMESMQSLMNPEADRYNVIVGNVHARLRMIALYAYAQSHDAVVVGTDNLAEWHMGYFTKFGDGGVDVVPLVHMTKGQVYEMARELSVPDEVLQKAPSAGLWEGQTDEGEMGISYAELDTYLQGGSVSEKAQERIDFWHNRSHHKREMAAAPQPPTEAVAPKAKP